MSSAGPPRFMSKPTANSKVLERNSCLQADNLLLVDSVRISEDGVSSLAKRLVPSGGANTKMVVAYWRDFHGEFDILRDFSLSLLNWALHVDIGNLLAQIGLRINKSDQSVLDLYRNLGSLLNGLEESPDCIDAEG